jgi:hypothetical protein
MINRASKVKNIKNFMFTLFFKKIKLTDIKDFKIYYDKNKRKYIKIMLKNGSVQNVPFMEYKLNKKGVIATSLTTVIGASALIGTIASFKYSKNDDEIKISPVDSSQYTQTIDESSLESEPLNNDINTINEEIDIPNIVVENNLDFLETAPSEINSINNNEEATLPSVDENQININNTPEESVVSIESESNIEEQPLESNLNQSTENSTIIQRELSTEGDSTRGISAYNNVMNYYNDILEYGTTYGIDPAIIASLMMEEGGSIYDPNNSENYYSIGFGQLNGDIWNGYTFKPYNYITGEYESFTLNVSDLYNNPRKQIQVITYMLQESAINYHGNIAAMLTCYNQGCGTVDNITNSIIRNNGYSSKIDVYDADNAMLIFENNPYTYGNNDYVNRIVTFLSFILDNNDFGRNVASVNLPTGEVVEYTASVQNTISR